MYQKSRKIMYIANDIINDYNKQKRDVIYKWTIK